MNDGPVEVTEDTAATGNVLTNDSDAEGAALTLTQFVIDGDATIYNAGDTATLTGVGTLIINANGSYTFTPTPDYNGPVPSATYTVSDGTGETNQSSTAVLSFTDVIAVDDAPIAVNDGPFDVTEDTPSTGNVLSNDTDAENDTLSVVEFFVDGDATTYLAGTSATIAGVGELVINTNGSFTFTPALNYNGAVPNTTYVVSDGEGGIDSAVLSFNDVVAINDAPTLADITTTITDTVAADSFDASTGTLVAADVDDTNFTYDFTDGTDTHVGTYGTLTLDADGSYSFAPNAAAIDALSSDTTETFTVRVTDNGGDTGIDNALSDTATFTIDITAANDTPIGSVDIPDQTQNEDFADYSIDLKEYFSDVETSAADLTYTVAGNSDISVTIVDGIATFSSATDDFNGVENISFTATDPGGESVTQDIVFTVNPVNDAPTIIINDVEGEIATGELSDSGSIAFANSDASETLTVSNQVESIVASSQSGELIVLTEEHETQLSDAFSIITTSFNSSEGVVNWDYTLPEGQLDFLDEGESVTATFAIIVTDNTGIASSQDITITLTGTGDTPVIQAVDVVGEVVDGSQGLSDSGSITFTDADLSATLSASEATKTIEALNQDGEVLTLTEEQLISVSNGFHLIEADTNTNNGTVNWNYTLEDGELAFLGENETITAVFTIIVTDNNGEEASQNVTLTLTGTNDIPEIQVVDVTADIVDGQSLNGNGSITFTDADLSAIATVSDAPTSINAITQNGEPLLLTEAQLAEISNAFTTSEDSFNTNNGTINWDYTLTDGALTFLGEGDTVNAIFTITVTDNNGATANQEVAINLVGSNSSIIVSPDNLDSSDLSFGSDFAVDVSSQFTELDVTDDILFEVSGLPNGLVFDPQTGVISGSLDDIGLFNIIVSASDGSETVNKAFSIEIIAPAIIEPVITEVIANDAPLIVEDAAEGNNESLNTSSDTVFASELELDIDRKGNDEEIVTEVITLDTVVSTNTLQADFKGRASEGLVRTDNVTISVGDNGQISFEDDKDTVETIDFKVQGISFESGILTIDISDDYRSQQEVYTGSYGEGEALPDGLYINHLTGQITGVIPDEILDEEGNVELIISAYNDSTNETRILTIKINVEQLKQIDSEPDNSAYVPLSEQLNMQNDKVNQYGHDLSKLFDA